MSLALDPGSSTAPKRATIYTLGCRLNESESGILRRQLERGGYDIVPFGEPADLAIINTCTVTAQADSKCRNIIRSFIRKNPQAFTAVIGCYSQLGYKVLSEIEGIDLIIGNQEKLNVLDYVKLGKNASPLVIRDRILRDDFTLDHAGGDTATCRANLKIQDGCDFMCSFCVIPMARGRARSRQLGNLLDEARALVDKGVKEIVLTGVNIGTYGFEQKNLLDVIEELNKIEALERLRISSIEPTTIPEEIFAFMNDPQHVLVPHLHVPLQSGSDKVLQAMKRRYAVSDYASFVEKAFSRVKDLCIGTDIMVGFPGETAEDFLQTLTLFRDLPIHYTHVFTYSRRDNTPASRHIDQVPEPEKNRRRAELQAASFRKSRAFYASFIGRQMPVLFESESQGLWFGHTENYVPVLLPSGKKLRNVLCEVTPKHLGADALEAEPLPADVLRSAS